MFLDAWGVVGTGISIRLCRPRCFGYLFINAVHSQLISSYFIMSFILL